MTNLQTFKFVFTAEIGQMNIKAKISSPTFVTWKRSQQSAISQTVDLVDGKADFKNQILKLPVNMYFDKDANCFQEKKSSFSFTMKTPKGQKTAGVVYIDLSKMLNNKQVQINEQFTLQKCPVKDSTVKIRITSQCLGQKSGDTVSQASAAGINMSTISTHQQQKPSSSSSILSSAPQSKQLQKKQKQKQGKQIKQVKQLKQKVQQLQKQNQTLKKQLERAKQTVKGDSLKQQLLKSKTLQDRLEEQVNLLRKQNLEHERQLEEVRRKMEETYTNLYSNLSKHFL